MSLIKLTEVTRAIQEPPLEILAGINLDLAPGDKASIVGRSGSGKSTLLNILGLIDEPTSGQVQWKGQSLRNSGLRDKLRGDAVGFIFQQFNLIEGLSATDNVAMPLVYCSDGRFWRRKELAQEMLERVGLGHRLEAPVTTLSGGEQQRVAIARALVRSPELILADEPTGALDIKTGEAIIELLETRATELGSTLVVITHDPAIAEKFPRQYRLDEGVLT